MTDLLTLPNAIQAGLMVFGVAAARLSQYGDQRVRRWSCIAGLIAQPMWFASAWMAGQWGILVLCLFYTEAYIKGFRENWMPVFRKSAGWPFDGSHINVGLEPDRFANLPDVHYWWEQNNEPA